ncbi:MAG: hypothetical protein RSC28_01645 [Bacteroidales bacterium]
MSEILNIDDRITSIEAIINKRENPIVYVFILLLAVASGIYSYTVDGNENIGLGLILAAVMLAVIGLKGLVLPKRILKYVPTGEKVIKKEYYYDSAERKEVEDCLKSKGFEMLKCLPQGKGTSLRVILYTTISGSYSFAQLQQYVPYEYKPVFDVE